MTSRAKKATKKKATKKKAAKKKATKKKASKKKATKKKAAKKKAAKKKATKKKATKKKATKKKATKKKATKKKAAKKKARDLKAKFGALPTAKVQTVYDVLAEHIVPKSDLEFGSAFELLVAVVLSAQSTDKAVNQATESLYRVARTPEQMHRLGKDGLIPFIQTLGLFNNKAKHIEQLSRILVEEHGGEVPRDRAALEALPGVGRKSANVVLNVAFGEPVIAVDTHIHRVANRLGIAKTSNPLHTEQVLLARTPTEHLLHAHHYLILHGRYCCKARKPNCWRCPVEETCPFPDKRFDA